MEEQTRLNIGFDRAVRAMSEKAFDRAVGILTERRSLHEDGARQLLQRETLS